MVLFLGFAALFLAASNGANDNFKGFATVWGSGSLGFRAALVLATGATVLGGLFSILIAEALLVQFTGRGLVGDTLANTPGFAFAVAGGAGFTVILATRMGYPISTTHALVGGLIGAGLALAPDELNVRNLGANFILPLLISPLVSAALAFLVYGIALQASRRLRRDGPRPPGGPRVVYGLHILSATSICFARGVNDTPKLAALLVTADLFSEAGSAIAVTVGMALGGLLLARRVAETMSLKINRLDPAQGTLANLTTAGLVLGATPFGLPVSTTHVSVGSIVGAGAAAGTLDLRVTRDVLLSWIATLPIAMAGALVIGLVISG